MSDKRIILDLDEFKPEAKKADPVAKASIEQVAKDSGFIARHAPETKKEAPMKVKETRMVETVYADDNEPRRRGRKRSTSRNTQFTVKLRLDTNNQIYDYAEKLNCSAIAEVIEFAMAALKRETDQGIDPRNHPADHEDE